jgi:methionyl-tRNA formyltransferase
VNYAIFNNSKYYGCTAHLVNNKIDNGKIVDVKKFKISKKDSIEKILIKTYKIMTRQAIYIINKINENSQVLDKFINKNKKFKWSKNIKKLKDLNKFYEIKNNISRKIFFKKIRATQTKNFKPYIFIHGKKFILE